MKKNTSLRTAALLLVLVMMTCCFVGGTLAKYVTKTNSADTVRVAYWGFEKTADINITDLFVDQYNDSVDSQNGEDVIAPGTTRSVQFAFNYDAYNTEITAPEVDYSFSVSTAGSTCNQDIQDNENIQWRLNTTENNTTTNGTWGTWAQLLTAIDALDGNKTSDKYEANTLPEAFDNDQVYTVEWQWNFYTADTADVEDTGMGNANQLGDANLTIAITAEQLD